jgi:hypothetical protein
LSILSYVLVTFQSPRTAEAIQFWPELHGTLTVIWRSQSQPRISIR